MTEEIIIDGVNIAGCKFLEEAVRYNNNAVCSCTDVRDCEGDLFIECCGEKPSCYYKQLQRLEQLKNKYYQQTLDDEITISDLIEEIQGLKADRTLERISKLSIENARLEQENKRLNNKNKSVEEAYDKLEYNHNLTIEEYNKYNKLSSDLTMRNIELHKQIEDLKRENKEFIEDNLNLSKENKELKEENMKVKKEFNNLIAEIISDVEFTGEIDSNGETPIEHLHKCQKALASLDTIQRMVLSAWEQGKYLDGGLYECLTKEFSKINGI